MAVRRSTSREVVFRGLNNVQDPQRLGLGGLQRRQRTGIDWAQQAENLDLDDSRAYLQRRGLARVGAGGETGFASHDGNDLYLVRGGSLYHVTADFTQTEIWSGLTSMAPAQFTEANERVYFADGVDFLVLEGATARRWGIPVPPQPAVIRGPAANDGGMPAGMYQFAVTYRATDGRESGASPVTIVQVQEGETLRFELPRHEDYEAVLYATTADGQVLYRLGQPSYWDGRVTDTGAALRTSDRYPPPGGNVVAVFAGSVVLGQYLPEQEVSVIWRSDPLSYELFDLYNFVLVPGEVRSMVGAGAQLYIGTDRRVHTLSTEGRLAEALDYGVPRGAFAATDARGTVVMWTQRGLCLAREGVLENVTEDAVSVPPGADGGVAIVEQDGFRKALVVVREDGQPHNAWEG